MAFTMSAIQFNVERSSVVNMLQIQQCFSAICLTFMAAHSLPPQVAVSAGALVAPS